MTTETTAANGLLDAALSYAARGWAVFPCGARSKVPLIPKKEGGRGVHDATTDTDQIRRWWTKHPHANIGVATGKASEIVNIDCDVRDDADGRVVFYEWQKEHGAIPRTPLAISADGGQHHILAYPADVDHVRKGPIAERVDCLADGAYFVAPPSVHPSGATYRWHEGRSPADVNPQPMPAWLRRKVYDSASKQPAHKSNGKRSAIGPLRTWSTSAGPCSRAGPEERSH